MPPTPPTQDSPPSLSSPSSSGSTSSTLTTRNHALTSIPIPSSLSSQLDSRSRSVSAPSTRSSSFAENLDRLAFIGPSAHKFPAALRPLPTSSDYVPRSDGRSSVASSSRSNRSSSSTPSSPRISPLASPTTERRAISRPNSPSFSRRNSGRGDSRPVIASDHRARRKRSRSWVHAPGAGFTPATPTIVPTSSARETHSRSRTPELTSGINAAQRPSHGGGGGGRPRSTSTSSPASPPATDHSSLRQALRQHSLSARTSPMISPMLSFTPVEVPIPRTRSVPHTAQMSPTMYGYGYGYDYLTRDNDQPGQLGTMDGYFALPPPNTIPMQPSSNDMPPPYTPSQVELQDLLRNAPPASPTSQEEQSDSHRRAAQQDEEEEEEGDENGFLSFSTQSQNSRLRRRRNNDENTVDSGLEDGAAPNFKTDGLQGQSAARHFLLVYLLHPLRLLAAVPGCVGTFWLLRNAIVLAWLEGSLWRTGRRPGALEFGLASLWSMTTAYHALSFTTLLLRRWLHYYSILPSFIRLIALQAICWPLVRLTLYVLGPSNPLASWLIISTTTAFSDTVARWVVSNITDDMATVSDRDGASMMTPATNNVQMARNRRRKRKRTVMAFWRAVMGGPSGDHQQATSSTGQFPALTESEAESDVDFSRRRHQQAAPGDATSSISSTARSQRIVRVFHWDVTIRRNVLPIAVLAYLSLCVILLEQVGNRA